MDEVTLITRRQAVEKLGITFYKLKTLVDAGRLNVHTSPVGIGRGGHRIFFDKAEVEQLAKKMAPFQAALEQEGTQ